MTSENKVYGGLLLALMVGAYLSWNHEERPVDTDEVVILAQSPDDITGVTLMTKTQTISMAFQTIDGQKAPWFELQTTKSKRGFLGNEDTQKLLVDFAPFKALRSLGREFSAQEQKDMKLDRVERKLVLQTKSGERRFDVGGRTSGSRDHYLRPEGKSEVFLVASRILADFEFPEGKYMQRKLRNQPLSEVEKVVLSSGGRTKTALQKNRQAGRDAFWASAEAPDEKNETLGNYIDKLDRLTASEYPSDTTKSEAAKPFLEVQWLGADDQVLANFTLSKLGEGKDADFFARASATRRVVKVSRFSAEQLERELVELLK